ATTDKDGRFIVEDLHAAGSHPTFAIYASHETPNGRFVKASALYSGQDATAEGTIELDAGDLYLAPVKTLAVLVYAGGSPLGGATVAFTHRDEDSPSLHGGGAEPLGWHVRVRRPLTPSDDNALRLPMSMCSLGDRSEGGMRAAQLVSLLLVVLPSIACATSGHRQQPNYNNRASSNSTATPGTPKPAPTGSDRSYVEKACPDCKGTGNSAFARNYPCTPCKGRGIRLVLVIRNNEPGRGIPR
ncbi:MAG: hypothetical protein ACAI25_07120, partial [Planctomycetota bacterium]